MGQRLKIILETNIVPIQSIIHNSIGATFLNGSGFPINPDMIKRKKINKNIVLNIDFKEKKTVLGIGI